MKHTTFDISFYCRESKTNRQGLAPVEMSIIINGERCIVTVPRKEVPSVRTGGIQHYSIEDLFDDYYAILQKRIGVDLTQKTYRKYELARDRLYQIVDRSKPLTFLTNALMKDYGVKLNQEYE